MNGRPEWARPAVGGVALGLVLLAFPQMYGVGYPVMGKALAGQYALWFIAILMLGKILASSLTLSIGGSGGAFAPSLFIGAMAGIAFGTVAHHVFGPAIGPPALYAVVAMGGVFAVRRTPKRQLRRRGRCRRQSAAKAGGRSRRPARSNLAAHGQMPASLVASRVLVLALLHSLFAERKPHRRCPLHLDVTDRSREMQQ